MYLDVALKILVSVLIAVAVICIPVLLKLWRAADELSMTLQTINQRLPLVMKNIEEISANLNSSTDTLNQKLQSIANASARSRLLITDVIGNLGLLSPLIARVPVLRLLRNSVALIRGFRVFWDVLLRGKKASTG
ncbi:MAG TPA: DUF948 domain-containing protein [Smithella sp.]|nr:DUF948 domain-containing protein [Smithella sp.]